MNDTGGAKDRSASHLVIVIVCPTKKGNVMLAPVITKHSYSDDSCVLRPGDHSFIKHESCVAYDKVKCLSALVANRELDNGSLILQGALSAEVYHRVLVGLIKSDESLPWALKEANDAGLTVFLQQEGLL
jgi:hypothetical protein